VDTLKTFPLAGFDERGEPDVTITEDGCLMLTFCFFPPSWVSDPETRQDLGRFKRFDEELAAALDTEVIWEDRELFVIPKPPPDAIQRIEAFLRAYPREGSI